MHEIGYVHPAMVGGLSFRYRSTVGNYLTNLKGCSVGLRLSKIARAAIDGG